MKYKQILAQKRGVAGLEILLSLIAMLFMIGIVVMVFVIGGAQLEQTVSSGNFLDSASVTNETVAWLNGTAYPLVNNGAREFQSPVITALWNATDGGVGNYNLTLAVANASVTGAGVMTNTSAFLSDAGHNVSVSYTYTWLQNPASADTINDTYQSLGTVTDWFPTFIILGAMVVLVLLVVIIITAIKRSKITEGA